MSIGYIHAVQVCQHVKNDPPTRERCLKALVNMQQGQRCLEGEDSRKALDHLLKAEADFDAIPAATFLLGIACAGIAAAYVNLEQWSNSILYSRKAVEISRHEKAFAETEANARMTLAVALASLGDLGAARAEFDSAEGVYKTLNGMETQLRALRHNRSLLLEQTKTSATPWWRFWQK